MNLADFRASSTRPTPPAGISSALRALWYDARGDWNAAHEITQASSADLDWVHAYLHRKEGDLGNAGYWYRRAGKSPATGPLDDEWNVIAETLLGRD
ncbi:MAG: hypothetical protein IPK16_08210 [Anaerolineales bacterium]|nr:hypothetical protein [Anaerolineales bacterium]